MFPPGQVRENQLVSELPAAVMTRAGQEAVMLSAVAVAVVVAEVDVVVAVTVAEVEEKEPVMEYV